MTVGETNDQCCDIVLLLSISALYGLVGESTRAINIPNFKSLSKQLRPRAWNITIIWKTALHSLSIRLNFRNYFLILPVFLVFLFSPVSPISSAWLVCPVSPFFPVSFDFINILKRKGYELLVKAVKSCQHCEIWGEFSNPIEIVKSGNIREILLMFDKPCTLS